MLVGDIRRPDPQVCSNLYSVLRHKAETMSSALVLSSLVYLLSFLGLDTNLGQLFLNYLYALPSSRTMELEGD